MYTTVDAWYTEYGRNRWLPSTKQQSGYFSHCCKGDKHLEMLLRAVRILCHYKYPVGLYRILCLFDLDFTVCISVLLLKNMGILHQVSVLWVRWSMQSTAMCYETHLSYCFYRHTGLGIRCVVKPLQGEGLQACSWNQRYQGILSNKTVCHSSLNRPPTSNRGTSYTRLQMPTSGDCG